MYVQSLNCNILVTLHVKTTRGSGNFIIIINTRNRLYRSTLFLTRTPESKFFLIRLYTLIFTLFPICNYSLDFFLIFQFLKFRSFIYLFLPRRRFVLCNRSAEKMIILGSKCLHNRKKWTSFSPFSSTIPSAKKTGYVSCYFTKAFAQKYKRWRNTARTPGKILRNRLGHSVCQETRFYFIRRLSRSEISWDRVHSRAYEIIWKYTRL